MRRFARQWVFKVSVLGCLSAGLILLAFPGTILTQATPRMDTVHVSAGGVLALRAALANGFFAKRGIDVQTSQMASSDAMRADLASGKLDIAESGLDNAVAMVALAGADVIVVTGASWSDQELIAQPDNKSAKDLWGKTLVVDATNTQNALMLKKILLVNGLKENVDYQLKSVPAGNRLGQLQEHKDYAGTMVSGAAAIIAKRQGFFSVGTSAKQIGPLIYGGAFVRRQWASEHAELLERYIAADIEAQRWLMNPANKDKVTEMLAGTGASKIPADVAEEAYQGLMRGPGALTKDLQLDPQGFANFVKLRAEVEGTWEGKAPAADRFYDLSYYKKALAIANK